MPKTISRRKIMRINIHCFFAQRVSLAAMLLVLLCGQTALAQVTAFSYQGRLTDAGNPANGNYDLQFKLFDALSGGAQQGATLTRNPVAASAGVFTVTLDFGANVFTGSARYLEIGVRPAGSANPYTVLAPRQAITSSPYAIQALNAAQLGGVEASRYVKGDASGNVTLGATSSSAKLTVSTTTTNATDNTATFVAPNIGPNGSHIHYGTNGDWYIRSASASGKVVLQDSGGTVGIGTANPISKLHSVSNSGLNAITGYNSSTGDAVAGLSISGRGLFGSSNNSYGVFGESPISVGVFGKSSSFEGVRGESSSASSGGVVGYNLSTGIGVFGHSNAGIGVQGRSTTGAGVDGGSTSGIGVYGGSTSASGVGVYGKNTGGGFAIFSDGNAGQPLNSGGLVKAMVFVQADGTIARCYNGITGSSTGNCGFSVDRSSPGDYLIVLPFNANDRFFSLTSSGAIPGIGARLSSPFGSGIWVSTFWTWEKYAIPAAVPSDFYLIIY
jgi:hypothetical protein